MADSVAIRLGLEGDQVVLQAFERIGREGQQAMRRLSSESASAGRGLRDLGDNTTAAAAGIGRLGAAAIASVAGLAAAYVSIDKFKDASDTFKKVNNNLTAAGVPAEQLKGLFDQLYDVAQRNAVPIEALSQLYGRLSQAQTTLKVSSADILALTETVGKSLRVSGQSAEQASGALLQLAQALSGGKVQAEEYNSLLDGMYPLLRAAAAGMKEAGGDVAKLTALVKDGEISSRALFKAIEAGAPLLDQQLAGAQDTVAQGATRMANEFVRAVAEFDALTGASGALGSAMNSLAGTFMGAAQGAARLYNDIAAVIGKIREFVSVKNSLPVPGDVSTMDGFLPPGMNPLATDTSPVSPEDAAKQRAYAARRAAEEEAAREMDRETRRGSARTGPIRLGPATTGGDTTGPRRAGKPISYKDFPADDDDDEGGGGKAGRASKERLNAYEREVQAINKRRDALDQERSTIGQSAVDIERAKTEFQLLAAAKEANIPITEALRADVERLASAYANAKVAVDEAKETLKAQNDLLRSGGQALGGFLSDLGAGGKSAERALENMRKKVIDLFISAALLGEGPLGKLLGLGGTNGGVGGLLGLLAGGLKSLLGGGLGGGTAAAAGPLNILPSFDVGATRVPMDMVAKIHKDEMIVPAFEASILRRDGLSPARQTVVQPKVNVYNQSGAKVQARTEPDGTVAVSIMDATNARGVERGRRGYGPFAGLVPAAAPG